MHLSIHSLCSCHKLQADSIHSLIVGSDKCLFRKTTKVNVVSVNNLQNKSLILLYNREYKMSHLIHKKTRDTTFFAPKIKNIILEKGLRTSLSLTCLSSPPPPLSSLTRKPKLFENLKCQMLRRNNTFTKYSYYYLIILSHWAVDEQMKLCTSDA